MEIGLRVGRLDACSDAELLLFLLLREQDVRPEDEAVVGLHLRAPGAGRQDAHIGWEGNAHAAADGVPASGAERLDLEGDLELLAGVERLHALGLGFAGELDVRMAGVESGLGRGAGDSGRKHAGRRRQGGRHDGGAHA